MIKKYFASILRLGLLIALLAGLILQPQFSVSAAAVLTVEPITWNVIGLDSNNVSVGPNHFPIGARICNTGDTTATNLNATFVWDSANALVNLRPGTLTSISTASLAAGSCTDVYFEVEITRNAAAYDTTRNYHIAVTADAGVSASTPTPRTLYVEHLVSQNRNAVTDIQYGTTIPSLTSVAPGGTMTLMVGNTYFIRLVGFTATQGYEQLESFINIPNVIFQTLSVSTTYTADTSATVSSPNDKAYGDACVWENNPNSPNYRSCLSTGKTGGNITVTYQVKILQVPGAPLVNPAPLSSLIYDFSGSSYHYNADYGVSTRYANVINASLEKSFSPKTITAGSNSTLTFTINNPGAAAISSVNFTDDLPNNLNLANANVGYSGCGTPLPTSGSLVDPMSFSNITVAGNSTCTITVTVTSNTDGIYNNTTSTLKLGTTDTGDTASDTLVVSSTPPPPTSCTTRTEMARWTFENYAALAGNTITAGDAGPFDASSTILASTPQGIYRSAGSSASAIADSDLAVPAGWTAPTNENTTTVWGIRQSWLDAAPATPGNPSTFTSPFFEFQVNTGGLYGGVGIGLDYDLITASGWNNGGTWYVLSSPNGTTWSQLSSGSWAKGSWQTGGITATSTSTSTNIYFRIYLVGASSAQNANANAYLDNVIITGCPIPLPPTIRKSFATNPVSVGNISVLTFTLTNPNASALSGVSFTDVLPGGMTIHSTPGVTNTCGGSVTAAANTQTISLSGGTINGPANTTCSISVNVRGTAAGSYTNTSTNISSTQTGPNTSTTPNVGFAQASLTVIASPVIAKSFTANPIFTGNNTSLTFSINNPNTTTTLTGVNFTDNLPAGLVVATPNGLSNTCGGTATAVAASSVISLSGVSLAAGASCTVTVNVTGSTAGLKANSVTVASTNGGTGNISTANVLVKDPAPAINLLKQVGPTASGPWASFLTTNIGSNVYYRFVVENTGDVALSNVSVSDPTVSTAGCSWTQGDSATPVISPFALPIADAGNNHIATCVLGPIVAVSGSNTNTATASGTNGSTVTKTSSATYGTPALTLVKSVTETSFTNAGDTLNYSYQVTNTGFAPLFGPVTVADDKATVTCPAVSTAVQTAPPGPGDGDNYLDIGERITCTASYTVLPGDATAGFVTNIATATVDSINSNQVSVTVNQVRPDLTVTKANNVSGSVAQNGSFNWTIAVINGGAATASFANTQVIMTDTLPGVAGYYPQGALTVTNGGTPPTGTINCSITGTALSCVANGAVTLPVNASFSVTLAVTPTAAGSLANTATVDPNGNITESNEGNNTGADTVTVVAPPSISKSFSPNPTEAGVASTLTITISNSNTATALTGVAFTDTYPAGLVNTTPASTSNTCSGTLTAADGGGSISLSGGSIAANGSCTITTTVVAAAGGDYANTTGSVTSTNGGTGNTGSSTLQIFDAQPSKSIVITSEPSTGFVSPTERVTIGEMIRYRLATKMPEGSFTNVQLVDGLPTGLQFVDDGTATVAFVCNGGAACMTSSTLAGVGLVVSGSSNNVSPTFTFPGSAISGGPFGSGIDVTFSFGNITNTDTDSDSEYIVVEFNALVLNVNSSVTINQGIDNQTGANVNNNRQNDVTLLVNSSTVGSTSPNVTVSIAEPSISAITKSVSPVSGPYLPGDSLTYTIQFSNNATGNNAATAFDVVLADTFNANLTLGSVNVSSTQGISGVATCTGGTSFVTNNSTVGQLVTVNVSCLDPGSTVTVTVNATISGVVSSGTTISNSSALTYTSLPGTQGNCATSPFTCTDVGGSGSGTGERNGSGGAGADGTVLNNYATNSNTTTTTVTFGSITITKDASPDDAQDFAFTGSGPNSYNFGGGFSLDDDADGTLPNTQTFTPLAPGSYTVVEGAVSGWSLTGLTCTDPDSGSSTDLGTATATIDLDAGENIPCTFTNTQTVLAADLSIVKDDSVTTYSAGGSVTYTVTVTNNSGVTVTGATVADTKPANILDWAWACTTVSGGATGCDAAASSGNDFSDTVNLPVGGQIVYTVTANIVASPTGDLVNTATVAVPSGYTDTNTANNSSTDTDSLLAASVADLSLTKTVNNSSPLVATNIIFTLTVTNANTSTVAATNVVVSDVIPGGFSYVGDTPSQGSYNSGTGDWSVGTLAIGASATLNLTVSVNVTGPYTNYAQITGVDQVDPDSTPNNGPQTPDEDDDDSVTITPTQNDPSGLSKSVSGTNQAFTTNPNVAIGEIVEYTVNVTIPPGVFTNAQMVDTMERGLSFMTCASIVPSNAALTTDVAGSFASACSTPTVDDAGGGTTVDVGRRVTFDLGTLTNASGADQTLTFVYTAVVLDSAANVSGVALSNSAAWSSDSGSLPPSSATVLIVEPDVSISKTANTSLVAVGSEVTITLTIQHTGSSQTNAYDTVVTDVLPAELQFVPGSLICTSGAQDPDVTCAESGGTITAEWSNFALGGGNGQITFRVTVVSLPTSGISNVANVAWTSLPGVPTAGSGLPAGQQNSNVFSTERDYDPASQIDVYGTNDTLVLGVFSNSLPATGFAPNEVTDIGNAPSVVYKQTGGVTVEVPSLGINLPIVGVPLENGEWDVSWLGNQAGWLDGSAFPSWSGNSVLTGHVYGSDGLPGPFVNLNGLRYGDKIVVHAYGQTYTYEVRANTVVEPNDASIFKHEDKAWLTLVTCKEYDEETNTYGKRVVVRAVLVGVARR